MGHPRQGQLSGGIAQSMNARQDLIGEPPNRHGEVLILWGIPGKVSSVEGIAQDILGRQDLKIEPPDRHVKVIIQ